MCYACRMRILEIFFQLERLLLIILGTHTRINMTAENRMLLLLTGGCVRLILLMMHLVSVRYCAGTTFSGSADSYGLLSTVGALDRIVITLDGRLHRIVRCALRRLCAAVMLQRLIVRRSDWWIKRARDGADVVETGAKLIARHHHTVRYAHCGYTVSQNSNSPWIFYTLKYPYNCRNFDTMIC